MVKKGLAGSIKIDYILLISFIILTCVGILTIYSASVRTQEGKVQDNQYARQIYWAITGVVIFVLILFVDYHKMGEYAFLIYAFFTLMLLLTFIIGKRVRGAKSWIPIAGSLGFQPSEFMKIAVIVTLARFLDRIGEEIKRLRYVVLSFVVALFPAGLILLQPDFGTALVYIPICLVMLYFAGIRYIHLISVLIIFAIAGILPLFTTFSRLTHSGSLAFIQLLDDTKLVTLIALLFGALSFVMFVLHRITKRPLLYKAMNIFFIFFAGLIIAAFLGKFMKPYQKERLIVFLKPTIDPFGSGYNIIQSKIAVGAGGFVGKGLLGGTQSQLGFLPERTTDFIFSIFAEAWGFLGSLILLALYALFLYRNITVIYEARDKFSLLLASGITGMFLFHIIVNLGMTIGIMPITGIPLPFMSYGGSFLLTCFAGVGILMNIEMRRYFH
jgi:rod shape determining protein RodA